MAFNDYDLPGFKTVDHVCVLGSEKPHGSTILKAISSACTSPSPKRRAVSHRDAWLVAWQPSGSWSSVKRSAIAHRGCDLPWAIERIIDCTRCSLPLRAAVHLFSSQMEERAMADTGKSRLHSRPELFGSHRQVEALSLRGLRAHARDFGPQRLLFPTRLPGVNPYRER